MKISIVVPCYNAEAYIIDCLESIYRQSYDNYELICVDDGSSDMTVDVINQFVREKEMQCKLITSSNKGQCSARNIGLREATGDYVFFLDADDLILPQKIQHTVTLIEESVELPDIIVGECLIRYANGNEKLAGKVTDKGAWYGLLSSQLGSSSSNFYRIESIRGVGGWDEYQETSVEYDLMFRMLIREYTVKMDYAPLTIIRERQGSITQKNKDENIIRFIELRKRMLQYLEQQNLLDTQLREYAEQVLFATIRRLYAYDPKKGKQYYNELIPQKFKPIVSSTNTYLYVRTYSLFGFHIAQHMWKIRQFFRSENVTGT